MSPICAVKVILRSRWASRWFVVTALLVAHTSCSGDDAASGGSPDAAGQVVDAEDAGPDPDPGGGEDCSRCGQVGTLEFDPGNLCEQSGPIVAEIFACLCGTPTAPETEACGPPFGDLTVGQVCADSACAGAAATAECGGCAAIVCGPELFACFNDT